MAGELPVGIITAVIGAPIFVHAAAPLPHGLPAVSERGLRIDIEGLGLRYGRTDVLSDIDLHIGAGERLCLVGPNGAGKSSLLRCLTGLAEASERRRRPRGRAARRASSARPSRSPSRSCPARSTCPSRCASRRSCSWAASPTRTPSPGPPTRIVEAVDCGHQPGGHREAARPRRARALDGRAAAGAGGHGRGPGRPAHRPRRAHRAPRPAPPGGGAVAAGAAQRRWPDRARGAARPAPGGALLPAPGAARRGPGGGRRRAARTRPSASAMSTGSTPASCPRSHRPSERGPRRARRSARRRRVEGHDRRSN